MADLSVRMAGLELRNPVILASGTCGYGTEMAPFFPPSLPGAVTLKGLSLHPRAGNPPPRLVETGSGVLNAIGLQNMGYDRFLTEKLPAVRAAGITAIANISGDSPAEYAELCRRLDTREEIAAVELNVSCPNVKEGGIIYGQDRDVLGSLVRDCRRALSKPLFVKLSPNVTDITDLARVCEAEGADGLTLINTLLGMAIDIRTRRPLLANITGGYSGPAIKPVALRMVWQVSGAVDIPVIGMGGVMTWMDAAEFLIAGASAVGVGTATMANPGSAAEILEGLNRYLDDQGIERVTSLIGSLAI